MGSHEELSPELELQRLFEPAGSQIPPEKIRFFVEQYIAFSRLVLDECLKTEGFVYELRNRRGDVWDLSLKASFVEEQMEAMADELGPYFQSIAQEFGKMWKLLKEVKRQEGKTPMAREVVGFIETQVHFAVSAAFTPIFLNLPQYSQPIWKDEGDRRKSASFLASEFSEAIIHAGREQYDPWTDEISQPAADYNFRAAATSVK